MTFNNREEYLKFWNEYYTRVLNYCWDGKAWDNRINVNEYYKYSTLKLNKDGRISKPHDARGLLTEKAKKKQRKNWLKYLERKKEENEKRRKQKEIIELEGKIKILQERLKDLKGGSKI